MFIEVEGVVMEKLKELRMTMIILVLGCFLLTGCFFNKKYTITFKTNGGSTVDNITVRSGNTITEPEEPTKEGYIFDGWYLDGEEFNFDTEISEDMTLVAKWSSVDVVEGEDETSTTTTTTTQSSNNRTTTRNNTTSSRNTSTTTRNNTTSSRNTSTTTRSTIANVVNTTTTTRNTTTTTSGVSVATTTTRSTTTSGTSTINTSTTPTSSITSETTTTTTTKVVPINISVDEEEVMNIAFDVDEELSNVESKLDILDYDYLMSSDKTLWQLYTDKGIDYAISPSENEDGTSYITLSDAKEIDSFTISDGSNSYIFDYNEDTMKWEIKYPGVSLGIGINIRYYANLEVAVALAKENETITLFEDQEVLNTLIISQPITIDGSDYKIHSTAEYLFTFENLNAQDSEVLIKNFTTEVLSFMDIKANNVIKNITFSDIEATYRDSIKNSEGNIILNYINVSFYGLL